MTLWQSLRTGGRAVRVNKLRSGLTMLGLIIGVAAVIATIAVGAGADVVVFDPATVNDAATYEDPHRYPTGIEHVIVNGQVALEQGETTNERAGRFLRLGPDLGGA